VETRPPSDERLAARLGRMARARPPTSRAKAIAWLALGGVLLGLLVGMALGWVRFSWVDRLAERKREEQQREREERPAPADPGR